MTQTDLPYQSHSATSRAAAKAIKPSAKSMCAKVLNYLRVFGKDEFSGISGRTDEEMQEALGMNPSTQRPRRIELVRAGLIEDSGRTRLTRSGRPATVWIAL